MSNKVVAIISKDEFIKARVSEIESKRKQFHVEMDMLKKNADNRHKQFTESVKIEIDAIEARLRANSVDLGELTDKRHLTVDEESDAIFLYEHDPNSVPDGMPFFLRV